MFLDVVLPWAVTMKTTDELLTVFSEKIASGGRFRHQIVTNSLPTGKNGLHALASRQAPAFLECVLRSCPELDVNNRDGEGRSALDIAACSCDLESVVLLVEHGASSTPELLSGLILRFIDENDRQGINDRLLLIPVIQYLLNQSQPRRITPELTEPAELSLSFHSHHILTPRRSFEHHNDYDDLVHGCPNTRPSFFYPFRRLFGWERRMPCNSLAVELMACTPVLRRTGWNAGMLYRIGLSYRTNKGIAETLMVAFYLLAMAPTGPGLRLLRRITNIPRLKATDYDQVMAQYRLAWKDFIILVKTNEIFERDVACERRIHPGFKVTDQPWLSLQAIEEAQVEKTGSSRQLHRARLGAWALEEARAWYAGFNHQLSSEIEQERTAWYRRMMTALPWSQVEGVPNLAVLCQRALLNKTDLKAPGVWCALFHREQLPVAELASSSSGMAATSSSSRF